MCLRTFQTLWDRSFLLDTKYSNCSRRPLVSGSQRWGGQRTLGVVGFQGLQQRQVGGEKIRRVGISEASMMADNSLFSLVDDICIPIPDLILPFWMPCFRRGHRDEMLGNETQREKKGGWNLGAEILVVTVKGL